MRYRAGAVVAVLLGIGLFAAGPAVAWWPGAYDGYYAPRPYYAPPPYAGPPPGYYAPYDRPRAFYAPPPVYLAPPIVSASIAPRLVLQRPVYPRPMEPRWRGQRAAVAGSRLRRSRSSGAAAATPAVSGSTRRLLMPDLSSPFAGPGAGPAEGVVPAAMSLPTVIAPMPAPAAVPNAPPPPRPAVPRAPSTDVYPPERATPFSGD